MIGGVVKRVQIGGAVLDGSVFGNVGRGFGCLGRVKREVVGNAEIFEHLLRNFGEYRG